MIASRFFRWFARRSAALPVPARARARAVKELPDGGMVHARELGHRADALHLAIAEDGDAVGHLPQQVEVVSDHDYGQPEQVAQPAHEFVDAAGAFRVETRGRFVEKQQFRVECERAGQRGPLHHAAAELGRILRTDFRLQTGDGELRRGDFIDQPAFQPGVLAQRQADIRLHREARKHVPGRRTGTYCSGFTVSENRPAAARAHRAGRCG